MNIDSRQVWGHGREGTGKSGEGSLAQVLSSVPPIQVNNLGQRDMPVSINFWVPIELKGEGVWTVMVSHPQVYDYLWLLN